MQATLHLSALTKGKSQLSAEEVEETRKIANVCIHVEHVIGCQTKIFYITKYTLPIRFLTIKKGEDIT